MQSYVSFTSTFALEFNNMLVLDEQISANIFPNTSANTKANANSMQQQFESRGWTSLLWLNAWTHE